MSDQTKLSCFFEFVMSSKSHIIWCCIANLVSKLERPPGFNFKIFCYFNLIFTFLVVIRDSCYRSEGINIYLPILYK